jgi:hypothetical protein
MSTESAGKVPTFEAGEVVRVRDEQWLSAVVLPTGRACDVPEDAPDLGAVCCVPIALVRTPAEDEYGVKRWVEISDLRRAGSDAIAGSADEAAGDGGLEP